MIVLGCSHRARVHAPGEVWLQSIRVEGNKGIPDDDLIPGLSIERARRDGDRVDPYQLSLDTKRIRGAYLRMGFFEAKVESRIDHEDNAEIVVFTVVDGPRAKSRVSVTGLPKELPEDRVLAKLELKENAPFDYDLYDDGKEVVKAMVEETGYPYVDLDESVVTVDRKERVAVASYRVVLSGPRATFGEVTITGLGDHPALDTAIRGRLSFRVGDLYSPKALAETQRSLFDLGRFAQVHIDVDRRKILAVVPVTISVQLAGQVELKGGGGIGYEPVNSVRPYQARLRGGFSYVPDEYPLWTLSADAQLAGTVNSGFNDFEPKVRVFLNGQRIELFRPFIIGDVGAGIDVFTVESYTAAGPLLRLNTNFPLGLRWITAQLGWSFSYLAFTSHSALIDARAETALGLRTTERNGRFEQSLIADLRDKPLEPRKGGYLGVRLTEGGAFAGGAFRYIEIQPDLRAYIPIGKQSVLAFRLRGGNFFGDVPVTQRLFSGGAQNNRGFSARTLAPSVCGSATTASRLCFAGSNSAAGTDGDVLIGGEALLETGAELRIPLGSFAGLQYGTTLFLDGGDVTNALSDIDPIHLYWAAGVGMFLKFGGFKVRLDVGRRISRIGPDDLQYDPSGLFKNTALFLGVGETY